MLAALIEKYNERKAVKAWNRSTLGQALKQHTEHYFYRNIASLAGMSEEAKQKIVADFYTQVFSIDQDEDPFLRLRKLLATYVLEFSQLQVLCLTEEEKAGQFYADCPYISGELHHHIRTLAEHNEDLKQLQWAHDDITDDNLIGYCNQRTAVLLFYMNGMNIIRIERGDSDSPKDWFRPFLQSMLIWDEDNCRKQIALPSLLPGELDGLKHSTFMNMVVNGFRNPLYEWEKAYKKEAPTEGA